MTTDLKRALVDDLIHILVMEGVTPEWQLSRLLARLAEGDDAMIEAMAGEVFPDGWLPVWQAGVDPAYVEYRQNVARHKARAALAAGMRVVVMGGK